jgi:uncharacterized RDD family membrane protein YckC
MSCPRCGENCRCEPKPEANAPTKQWIDPEAYDASEQRFAASLDEPAAPRFVVEEEPRTTEPDAASVINASVSGEIDEILQEIQQERNDRAAIKQNLPSILDKSFSQGAQEPGSWRNEVAARLNRYRARRRAPEPRYPSLQLKFEPDSFAWSSPAPPPEAPALPPVTRQSLAVDSAPALPQPARTEAPESSARILEFPRSSVAPPQRLDELAEPVIDRPRILDVPDVEPPPPALGGIMIEPLEKPADEKRPGIEIPLQTAPLWRRLTAGLVDGVVVATALALGGYIFVKMAPDLPAGGHLALAAGAMAAAFWVAYQYLLLVYSGSTPGLRLARLQLCQFDGSAARRRIRRWRVMASILSGLSLGLGYAWCFLDEDQLCWHDRITRTHLGPTH